MLTLVTFKKSGERWEVPVSGESFTIGRQLDVDLRIPYNDVSRRHCVLNVNGRRATVRDLGSANGTFVNHLRVTEADLKAGDQLTIGPVTFVVCIDGIPAKITPRDLAPPEEAGTASRAAAPTKVAPPSAPGPAPQPADFDELSDIDLDLDDLADVDLADAAAGGGVDDDQAFDFLSDEGSDEDMGPPPKK